MKKYFFAAISCIVLMDITSYAQEINIDNGAYYQLGKYNNQPIIWRAVVDESDENGILMVSDDILCFKAFDPGCDIGGIAEEELTELQKISEAAAIRRHRGSNIWEESAIRTWLNSNKNAGDITWKGNEPSEENLESTNGYWSVHPYNNEKGFLHADNFAEGELSVIRTVGQWNVLPSDIKEKATNGITRTYLPFYEYGGGMTGVQRSGEVTFDDCHEAYSRAAAYRLNDTVFLLNESQIHSLKEMIGTPAAKSQMENSAIQVMTRTPYSGSVGVVSYDAEYFRQNIPCADVDEFIGGVRPAFYLNEETARILSGSGTENDPYVLDGEAQDGITVFTNAGQVDFDVEPITENDRTLVGMRAVFEALGADVEWEQDSNTAVATKDGITIRLQIDNDIMTKNGEEIQLDVPARIINDRTMVPLRAISEALNARVDWIEDLQRVVIDVQPEWVESDWCPDWYKRALNAMGYSGE